MAGAVPEQRCVRRCHLAFVAPPNTNNWSLTAIDKFNEYTKRYTEFAITIPSVVTSSVISIGVILWGLNKPTDDALAKNEDAWENINLRLIFQGVARSTIDIDQFQYLSKERVNFQMVNKHGSRWSAAGPCQSIEFIGKHKLSNLYGF